MTGTLNTLQKLAKLGKILSRIVYIFCLVGGIMCAVGMISMPLFPESVKLGGVTIHAFIEKHAEISVNSCYAAMAMGLILCAGEAVLAKLAEKYFTNELATGTPFTLAGASELMRLGICAICIPVGTKMIANFVYGIMAHFMQDVSKLVPGDTVSIGMGVMMIVASLLCKYGAEYAREAELPTRYSREE
ncbi:MAG: hypothetical protein IK019_06670 [Clostridia bacterium]|jgi:hypothetical protein|nr:hypothetical protein [Clostridia bacterium]MBR5986070.1 hypothetical protein [Clostridia bacterium]